MDGRGIAAAFALGAQGVSLGTGFLGSAESGAADVYAATLRAHARGPDGRDRPRHRPAGALDPQPLPGRARSRPTRARSAGARQAALVGDLRRAAAEQGRGDILPMLAGEGAALSGEREPAAEIVARLVRETEAALAGLAARALGCPSAAEAVVHLVASSSRAAPRCHALLRVWARCSRPRTGSDLIQRLPHVERRSIPSGVAVARRSWKIAPSARVRRDPSSPSRASYCASVAPLNTIPIRPRPRRASCID